jgi:GTP-sensing pleiotropic transcriptional regulator CodY
MEIRDVVDMEMVKTTVMVEMARIRVMEMETETEMETVMDMVIDLSVPSGFRA